MIPIKKVEQLINTYKELEKELASGSLNNKDLVKKSKEYSNLGDIIKEAKGYVNFDKEKKELEKIIEEKNNDKEMIQLAKNELSEKLKQHQENEKN